MKSVVNQHWLCVLALLPFAVMFCLHDLLGISDHMGDGPSDWSMLYNYGMVLAFVGGICGYLLHALAMTQFSPRGIAWFGFKFFILAIGWCVFTIVLYY